MSTPILQNAENIHLLFRGSSEVAKWLRFLAMLIEIAVATFAATNSLIEIFSPLPWAPAASTFALILALVLRMRARSITAFAEKCRRSAVSAYASGADASAAAWTTAEADAPWLTRKWAGKLPTSTLDEYYECTRPPGASRFREIYAHSSFYSWRLLRATAKLHFAIALFLGGITCAVIYGLAAHPTAGPFSARLLDLVCSFVLLVLFCKAFEASFGAWSSSIACKELAECFMKDEGDDALRRYTIDYDIERASGPSIPTRLYRCKRDQLQRLWHSRREDLYRINAQTSSA